MTDLLKTERIGVSSPGRAHVIDLTSEVRSSVKRAGMEEGSVLVFVPGSTAALTTIEFEPGLLQDLPELFDRLVPAGHRYHHDDTWHDGNGHSHLRACLLGPSLTIPVTGGEVLLGTWQQVVLVDFDNRPRQREVIVQLSGRRGEG